MAIPKFVELSVAAKAVAVQGIAELLGSASNANHTQGLAHDANINASAAIKIDTCDDVPSLLDSALDGKYFVSDTSVADGATVTCTVYFGSDTTSTINATFTAYGVD
jgi:hypothetical protein